MFDKILIANRGEIACRIIRTARAMGVGTVAVYSEADANALHVAMAEEAYLIGPPAPADSYLRADVLIEVALRAGAQAIHPGYGFLSENPDFVEAVEAAGLVFIGPSAQAIRAMGLKDQAKALMAEAGVPVVPGYHGADQAPAHLAAQADHIGYPVLIKAVAGGGGKGMRRVDGPAAFASALNAARAEAEGAFGNGDVLIEKFITQPRHIEVQVFGDGAQAVHLYERDCSLQRRHQKVLEEAPAPGMTAPMRAAMCDAALRAARAVQYKGAGTVEFVVDAADGLHPDRFWFMEMNTRLQVEHPVTEAVTGVDLVEWQLRVAAGQPLPVFQDQIPLNGHAVEARLYAEDPAQGFLPVTGDLAHLSFPQQGRIDSGVRAGDTISPHYDPMIAKLTTHAPDRAGALAKLHQALQATQVAGLRTNLGFLAALTAHQDVRAGRVETGLIARDLPALVAQAPLRPEVTAQAALIAAGLETPPLFAGFSLWAPMQRQIALRHAGQDIVVTLCVHGPDHIELDGVNARLGPDGWRFGTRAALPFAKQGMQITLFGPDGAEFDIPDPLARATVETTTDVIEAPMPGLVRDVMAAPGQQVAKGTQLAILEAMKMQHTLCAPRDGTVAQVLVAVDDQITAGAPMVRLEPKEDET